MAKQIAVSADLSNLYHCIRKKYKGKKIDFKKLLEWVKDIGQIVSACAYGSQVKDEAQRFIHCLHANGWETKYKRTNIRRTSWDVGITVDTIRLIDSGLIDTLVLCSANGDLKDLVMYCNEHNVSTIILACEISKRLQAEAHTIVEFPESLLEEGGKDATTKVA